MSFISWFLFVLYGGIGLAALPLDLIYDFATRPKKLTIAQMEAQKERIIKDTVALQELGSETRSFEKAKTENSKYIIIN